MTRRHSTLFLLSTLALAVSLQPFTAFSQDAESKPLLTPPPASAYNSYRLPKPADFQSMEQWVRDNFTHLTSEITINSIDGHATVAFWIKYDDNIFDHNIVTEDDEVLVLQTTMPLLTGEDFGGPAETSKGRQNARMSTASLTASLASCDTQTNRCNCVFYARCRVPSLPYGLTYYTDKKRIINSHTAAVGSVAIMDIYPPYGHVGTVKSVTKDSKGNITITLDEANYRACQITTTRSGTEAAMHITGYFKP